MVESRKEHQETHISSEYSGYGMVGSDPLSPIAPPTPPARARWQDMALIGFVGFVLVLIIWVVWFREDSEEITLQRVEQLLEENKQLAENDVKQNQEIGRLTRQNREMTRLMLCAIEDHDHRLDEALRQQGRSTIPRRFPNVCNLLPPPQPEGESRGIA